MVLWYDNLYLLDIVITIDLFSCCHFLFICVIGWNLLRLLNLFNNFINNTWRVITLVFDYAVWCFCNNAKKKAAEQANVTQTGKKKEEPVFDPCKKTLKISLARISILDPHLDKLYQTTFTSWLIIEEGKQPEQVKKVMIGKIITFYSSFVLITEKVFHFLVFFFQCLKFLSISRYI